MQLQQKMNKRVTEGKVKAKLSANKGNSGSIMSSRTCSLFSSQHRIFHSNSNCVLLIFLGLNSESGLAAGRAPTFG